MICIKDLIYRYDDNETISFPDIDINVSDKVLIVGPSGCGKSTLLNLIAGAIKIQKGSISFESTKLEKMSSISLDRFRAENIGYIFQTLNLIPFLSVYENIELGVKFSTKRASRVDDISEEIKRLINSLGLDASVLKRKVSQLSIGQQQRVAATRALLGKPTLLLADEPTSALDRKSAMNFLNEIDNTFDKSCQSLLMVSHDESLISYFDKVVRLN